jgi:hypothetical protein
VQKTKKTEPERRKTRTKEAEDNLEGVLFATTKACLEV